MNISSEENALLKTKEMQYVQNNNLCLSVKAKGLGKGIRLKGDNNIRYYRWWEALVQGECCLFQPYYGLVSQMH